MDTTLVEEKSTASRPLTLTAALDGAASTRRTERPPCATVDMFVAEVIYDGRFLDNFTAEPERVAEQLGIQPAPEVLDALRGRDSRQVLSETTAEMTRVYTAGGHSAKDPQAFFVVIGVAVGGTIVVCLVDVITGSMTTVEDPEADRKL